MSLEQNKRVAREFLEATFARDADRVALLLADGATYWAGGKHPRFSRIKGKDDWCEYLRLPTPFSDGLKLTVHAITAEEDRVAIEAESYGTLISNGRVYNNTYHFLLTFRGGRITTIREYMDTEHVNDILPVPKF